MGLLIVARCKRLSGSKGLWVESREGVVVVFSPLSGSSSSCVVNREECQPKVVSSVLSSVHMLMLHAKKEPCSDICGNGPRKRRWKRILYLI